MGKAVRESSSPLGEQPRDLSRAEKDEILRRYVPLVRRVVLRLARRFSSDFDFNETLNAGLIGLMDAVEKYDPSFESSFPTYAQHRIRGAILDNLRTRDWLPRSYRSKINRLDQVTRRLEIRLGRPVTAAELAEASGMSEEALTKLRLRVSAFQMVSLDDLIEEREQGDPEAGYEDDQPGPGAAAAGECLRSEDDDPLSRLLGCERVGILERAMSALSGKEREVLRLYYNQELNLRSIGEALGVTESRASQIRAQALRRLKHELKYFL